MEDHYSQVEEFTVGNCVGKVWTFLSYDGDGSFTGRDFDIEIKVGDNSYILGYEMPDLIGAYKKCLDFVEKSKKEVDSSHSTLTHS